MSGQIPASIPSPAAGSPPETPRLRPGLFARLAQFIASWRSLPPYELASYPLMFAAVPMLAAGVRDYDASLVLLVLFTVVSQYSGFFAALIWNDLADADIDAVVHPDRPIPGGRISKSRFFAIAVVLSLSTAGFAWLVSPWTLFLTLSAAAFVALHDSVFKRHMPLPAYSEIATPVQWVVVGLFGYWAVWSRLPQPGGWSLSLPWVGALSAAPADWGRMMLLCAFIYFTDSAHDIPEGIVDAEGDRAAGVRTYTTSFGPRRAALIGLAWFLISGALGVALFFVTSLSLLFLAGFLALFAWSAADFARLASTADPRQMRDRARALGRKGFNHYLFVFDLIFVDLLWQLVWHHLRAT